MAKRRKNMKEIKRVVVEGRTAGFAIEGNPHVYPTKGSAERALKEKSVSVEPASLSNLDEVDEG